MLIWPRNSRQLASWAPSVPCNCCGTTTSPACALQVAVSAPRPSLPCMPALWPATHTHIRPAAPTANTPGGLLCVWARVLTCQVGCAGLGGCSGRGGQVGQFCSCPGSVEGTLRLLSTTGMAPAWCHYTQFLHSAPLLTKAKNIARRMRVGWGVWASFFLFGTLLFWGWSELASDLQIAEPRRTEINKFACMLRSVCNLSFDV